MAEKEAKGRKGGEAETPAAQQAQTIGLGVRLVPADGSDQPVFANYTVLNAGPGVVFVDFGFLEPAMLAALPRLAQRGGKLPQSVNGRLAVRVALSADAVRNLKRQLAQIR
jgi:hypothetical protein